MRRCWNVEREARRLYHSNSGSHRRRRATSDPECDRNGKTRLEGKYHRALRDAAAIEGSSSPRRILLSTALRCARASGPTRMVSAASLDEVEIIPTSFTRICPTHRYWRAGYDLHHQCEYSLTRSIRRRRAESSRKFGYRISAALPNVVTAVSRAAADPSLESGNGRRTKSWRSFPMASKSIAGSVMRMFAMRCAQGFD